MKVGKAVVAGLMFLLVLAPGAGAALTFKKKTVDVGSSGYGVVAGKFGLDNRKDVVDIGSQDVFIFKGLEGGAFAPFTPFDSETGSNWGAAAGNFVTDTSRQDIVVVDNANNQIAILRSMNNSFDVPDYRDVGADPKSPAAGDFNRDGQLDVAVANDSDSTVSVILGENGTLATDDVTYPVSGSTYAVATGRINGDRRPDIISANNDDTISVLLANADGSMQPEIVSPAGPEAVEDVATGDFNKDGKIDVVAANYNPSAAGKVSVLLGRGNGHFRPPLTRRAGVQTWHVDVGDVNADRKLDVVAGNEGSNFVSVFLGKGNGKLRRQVKLGVGDANSQVLVEQLDGKRGADIVASTDNGEVTFAMARP